MWLKHNSLFLQNVVRKVSNRTKERMCSLQDLSERSSVGNQSEIQNFFEGSTVFITGATGYLGKLVLEKLLRSCPGIRHFYVLVRTKKDVDPTKRFEEIFDSPVFEPLKSSDSQFMKKVSLFSGDCVLPDLGLGEQDKQTLLNEVDCIFHFAATVRFDQKLKTATYINVRATKDLLILAKKMKQLKTFLYCSTAFSFCPRKEIGEKFYEPRVKGDQLLELVELLDDDVIDDITDGLMGDWPNTYSFTKAAAENIVEEYGAGLPVSIVKPSILLSTLREPVPGWVTFFGLTGVGYAICIGVLRVIRCVGENLADLIPADYAVNCAIAVAWRAGRNQKSKVFGEKPFICNFVSGAQNPITWIMYRDISAVYGWELGSEQAVWYSSLTLVTNLTLYRICNFMWHVVPAYIVDFALLCIGREPMAVALYKKYYKFTVPVEYFAIRQWKFEDENCRDLWRSLSAADQQLFCFDIAKLNWEEMLSAFMKGGRLYMLKEPLDNVERALYHVKKLRFIHYTILIILAGILFYVLLMLNQIVF